MAIVSIEQHLRSAALVSTLAGMFPNATRARVVAELVQDASAPFAKTLPEGNLRPDSEMTDRANPRAGALYFYNCLTRTKNNPSRHPMFSFLTLAFTGAVPGFQPDIAKDGRFYKTQQKGMQQWLQGFISNGYDKLTTVKKTPRGFEVTVPVSYLSYDTSAFFLQRMIGRTVTGDEIDVLSSLQGKLREMATGELKVDFPTSRAPSIPFFSKKTTEMLRALPQGHIFSVSSGKSCVIMLKCLFTIPECEHLTQIPWAQIRPFDIFQLMRLWAQSRQGSMGGSKMRPAPTSKPLQYIADTRVSEGTPRLDEYNIFIDENAEFWRVPVSYDRIGQFDAEAARNYSRSDGSMSGVLVDGQPAPDMPAGLVFIDWLNLKLCYNNTSGVLTVKELARVQAATKVHYKTWLDRSLLNDAGELCAMARSASAKLGLPGTSELLSAKDAAASIYAEKLRAGEEGLQVKDIRIHDICSLANSAPSRYKAYTDLLDALERPGTLEQLYDALSVSTVHTLYGYLTILLREGPTFYEKLYPAFREATRAYREQGLDSEYTPEAVPYIDDGKFLQPHQNRCMNRMRGSPKFAILSVAAGGGKTILAITDFLKELKNGNVKRGMIMCPTHLVAQYVKEVVDFVNGRLNVIALTSYTLKSHGLEGLKQLIQSAPPNTFVVADYGIVQGATKNAVVGYGGARTNYQPLIELVMSFSFDWVCLDESHTLKNSKSNRTRAISKVLTTIPYKRVMSGTLMPDSVQDLVQQVRMLDPTIFGTDQDFVNRYSTDGTDRGKRTRWKEGFADMVMSDLKDRVCWVQAHRKEWAALLPKLVESARDDLFLTAAQQECYNDILAQTIKELQSLPKNHKFKKLLSGKSANGDEDDDDDDEDGDDDSADDLTAEQLLRRNLQALEMFVSNPMSHALGRERLKGQDAISPKVGALIRVMQEHIANGEPGKILIFCNYRETAQHIYDNLPPDLRAGTIHYEAENKTACVAEFSGNDAKFAMVGVETSMNTGLNLQMASRLVRVDTVWTPGALEQGNSRVLRPNVKVQEFRNRVYIDWLLVQRTIDITKSVYLFSKRVLVGLVENAGNPLFDGVQALTPIPLSLDVIAESNSVASEDLQPYFETYAQFMRAQARDFEEYKRDHPDDLDPETGMMRRVALNRAPNLPNSKLMMRVPYVPGTELYGASDLGLQRYDVYMRLNSTEVEELENEEEESDKAAARSRNREELNKIGGLGVHTEYGDGIVSGVTSKELVIEFSDGSRKYVNKMACFFITRKQTNAHDMRAAVLEAAGEVPYDKVSTPEKRNKRPVSVPAQDIVIPKPTKKKPVVQDTRVSVALQLIVTNDFVGLEMSNASKNKAGAMVLQALGFRQPEPYVYTALANAPVMLNLFKKWSTQGFKPVESYNRACKDLYVAMSKMRKNAARLVGLATQADLVNFYRRQHTPIKQKGSVIQFCPYPMVQDDVVYLCLPLMKHPETLQAIKTRVPGVKWANADTDNTLQVFFPSLSHIDRALKRMSRHPDLIISNMSDLLAQRKRLQVRSPALVDGLR